MKISAIRIENFRGSAGPWSIDFCQSGKPSSLLILGENGTGKSTIVDAIEFCLQGARRPLTWRNIYAEPTASSSCEIEFIEPDHRVSRENEAGSRHSSMMPVDENFRRSYFTIRRRELERFVELSDRDRSELLAGYLRFSDNAWVEDDYERSLLVEDLEMAKRELATKSAEFGQLIGRDCGVFNKSQDLEALVLELRGGDSELPKKQRRELPQLPHEQLGAVQYLRTVIAEVGERKRRFYYVNREVRSARLGRELSQVSDEITQAFLRLLPGHQGIRDFVFTVQDNGSPAINLEVHFENGHKCPPARILSEAAMNLLGLLTFLFLTKAATRYGQPKLMVLDDLFGPADSGLRQRIANFLFESFSDWQLVITFHDKLWHEQFRRAAQTASPAVSVKSIQLFPARRVGIPPIAHGAPPDASHGLRLALDEASSPPQELAAKAGYLLETLCEYLSINLRVKVERTLSEAYSLGDLWPGIKSALSNTRAGPTVVAVNSVVHTRNMSGSHYTEWGAGLSSQEAFDFSRSVLDFWDSTFCLSCRGFVRKRSGQVSCSCGAKSL